MSTMRSIILVVALLLTGCKPEPTHTPAECWAHRDCVACVSASCGWCGPGCYSFQTGTSCEEPVGFVGYCPGAFPEVVPYGSARGRRDAGVSRGD